MNNKIVIFGAGEWGKIAYHYYCNVCKIVGYVDNDSRIWGKSVNGIPIYAPDFLKGNRVSVVIANKRYQDDIKKQLQREYGISEVVVFEIRETVCYLSETKKNVDEKQIIIGFSDGLGNQMFQYTLYSALKSVGKNVKADLSAYSKPGMMQFVLPDVFEKIQLDTADPNMREIYIENGNVHIEQPPKNKEMQMYDESIFHMEKGYIEGYYTSYKYAERIKKKLMEDFSFNILSGSELEKITNYAINNNTVGVQVRRGDFLNSKYYREIGCHCDKDYYQKAIEYMRQLNPDAKYIYVSNDIEWVKNNLGRENDLYIEKSMFDSYEDWYDMCIMTHCKHNIIPNSTFGWWGAWLNNNPNKIVIAPRQWRTNWNGIDWCPPDWMRV